MSKTARLEHLVTIFAIYSHIIKLLYLKMVLSLFLDIDYEEAYPFTFIRNTYSIHY